MSNQVQFTVKLIGAFRISRFKEQVYTCPAETRVEEIVDQLEIPRRAVGTVLINGLHAKITDQPRAGDIVALLPILGGG